MCMCAGGGGEGGCWGVDKHDHPHHPLLLLFVILSLTVHI